ncbi:S-adenosyl-L-methionine-dependent methyltransferase [Polychytrium aggregatum]|uniref:S-adenosyl-L-methionine-dependent methyltransferase n=1 Tax=Polychytrium aggregatum TaxID=110093 RepID=UPI0022FEA127|nr:S-adenosyl-L-methionine-dependent methyltransferase [Polychytrium aggregatum]KAI9207078.1 S-adenosyl-L-methionine-dependent methyltransferase [Polychytrium aggregatum]
MPSCIVSLDKATPGLVLCLKTQEAETAVRQMVADGLVEFRWTALCLGDLSAHPLVQTGDHPTSFIVSEPLDGVAAATKCAIIATVPTRNHPSGYLTLVELTPQNGMLPQTKYQVRLHLECLGHSVIGNGKHTADFRTARGKGIFLALVGVSLQHPFTQQRLDVEHGPPAKFEALCSREEQTVRKKRELELEELKQHREQLEAQGLSISSEHPTLHSNGISEVPLAYITGTKRFFRHNFHVNSSVLIPRQGTETLVQASIELLQPRSDAGQSVRVLDLGTGSGCLLISILASLAGSVGVGLDISPEALDIAQRNAQDNGVASRARFAVGTFERIYESLEPDGAQNPMPFDLVVCNPPYLSHRKARLLEGRTLNAEPAEALVSGATGMEAYEAIIAGLDALHRNSGLSSDAILVLEIGHGMAHDVGALFSRTPIWLLTECRTDANGLDRCLVYRLMPSNLCL